MMKREQILARVIIRVRLGMATEEERELLESGWMKRWPTEGCIEI